MAVLEFPPVELADENGFLAIGGDLEVPSLVLAYRSGIFPWPIPGVEEITWFAPPRRAVLFLDKFHVSRSLNKVRSSRKFEVKIDANTPAVIQSCASSEHRLLGNATWITAEMIEGYSQLAVAGYCHSVESYLHQRLVGGLYGVAIGAMFAGESMFYTESEASKIAFLSLVEHLSARGCWWIDCQQLTPMFEQFGAEEISRDDFMELLQEATTSPIQLFD